MEKLKKKVLALIPARGNSKSIKKKNLTKINGKTLIQLIFDKTKKSKLITKTICSSEDIEILKHCKNIGLDFILRPKKFSKDNSGIFFTAQHAINTLKKKGDFFDILLLIQPTSPFVNSRDFDKVIKSLIKYNHISSCQTIHETPHNYHYLNTRIFNEKKKILYFKFNELRKNKINKQAKEKTYHFGNLVACKIEKLLSKKNFFCKPSLGLVVDRFSSFDLDNESDLKFLNYIHNNLKKKN